MASDVSEKVAGQSRLIRVFAIIVVVAVIGQLVVSVYSVASS